MIDFNPRLIIAALAEAWLWWWSEISGLAGKILRTSVDPSQDRLLVRITRDSSQLISWHAGLASESALFPQRDPAIFKAALRKLLDSTPPGDSGVTVDVHSELVLRTELTLPEATEEDLRKVLTYELDRRTPFTPEQVYFSYVVVGRDKSAGEIRLALSLVPKEALGGVLACLNEIDLVPDAFVSSCMNGTERQKTLNFDHYFNALRKANARNQGRWIRLTTIAVLLAAVLLLPPLRLQWEISRLAGEIGQKTELAGSASSNFEILERMKQQGEVFSQRRQSFPPAVQVLKVLTKLLPPGTWVRNFQLHDRRLDLEGQSDSASALLGILEKDPLFENARMTAPILRDEKHSKDRFSIAVDLSIPAAGSP